MDKQYNSNGKLSYIIGNKFYRPTEILSVITFETSMIVGPDHDDPLHFYGVCFITRDEENPAELFLNKNARDRYFHDILPLTF